MANTRTGGRQADMLSIPRKLWEQTSKGFAAIQQHVEGGGSTQMRGAAKGANTASRKTGAIAGGGAMPLSAMASSGATRSRSGGAAKATGAGRQRKT